jgi:hypothetical protein
MLIAANLRPMQMGQGRRPTGRAFPGEMGGLRDGRGQEPSGKEIPASEVNPWALLYGLAEAQIPPLV